MMRVFIDTSVVLDTLIPGRLYQKESLEIIGLHNNKDFRLQISSLSIANIAFCARKYVSQKDLSDIIAKMSFDFKILNLGAMDISDALKSKCPDFEDALQISAAEMESDVIVTGNKKHFSSYTALPVYTPKEFIDKLKEASA